jgi:hypothetical protein
MASSGRASSSQEAAEMLVMLASFLQLLLSSFPRNHNFFRGIFAMPLGKTVTLQLNLSVTNGVSSFLVH